MIARLKGIAEELDLPFGERKMTFNSRLAQELGKWAEDQGRGEAFHRSAFLAYFRDGENIARHGVLLNICQTIGLNPAAARTVLEDRTYRHTVDDDWQLSRRMGITAVPTFVIGNRRLVGAQTGAALEEMLASAGAQRRQSEAP